MLGPSCVSSSEFAVRPTLLCRRETGSPPLVPTRRRRARRRSTPRSAGLLSRPALLVCSHPSFAVQALTLLATARSRSAHTGGHRLQEEAAGRQKGAQGRQGRCRCWQASQAEEEVKGSPSATPAPSRLPFDGAAGRCGHAQTLRSRFRAGAIDRRGKRSCASARLLLRLLCILNPHSMEHGGQRLLSNHQSCLISHPQPLVIRVLITRSERPRAASALAQKTASCCRTKSSTPVGTVCPRCLHDHPP